jgi:hypothetical protein
MWGILSRSVDHNKKIFKTENKHKKTCSTSAGLSRYESFMNARSDFYSCSATSTSLTTKSFMNSSRGYFNIISSNLKLIQMIKNYQMMNESHNNMSYKDNTFFLGSRNELSHLLVLNENFPRILILMTLRTNPHNKQYFFLRISTQQHRGYPSKRRERERRISKLVSQAPGSHTIY